MFISRAMIIKTSAIADFVYFLLMAAKKLVTVWVKILVHLKDLIEFFQKMIGFIGLRVIVREILRVKISEKLFSQQKIPKSCIFKGCHLAMAAQNPKIHSIFQKI